MPKSAFGNPQRFARSADVANSKTYVFPPLFFKCISVVYDEEGYPFAVEAEKTACCITLSKPFSLIICGAIKALLSAMPTYDPVLPV